MDHPREAPHNLSHFSSSLRPGEAMRPAVLRRRRGCTTVCILGRERKGVYYALRDWLGWSRKYPEEAARRTASARPADLGLV